MLVYVNNNWLDILAPKRLFRSAEIELTLLSCEYRELANDMEYCEKITLQSIANRFNIAPSYLCQIFQKEIGMTFTKYITRLRIAKAAKLLSDTALPIAAISDETGFSQYYYFAKVFKKTMGVTPSEYREEKGAAKA